MSLIRLERVGVVVSNVTILSALINVADEQQYLQRYMSPEAFEECMAGDTNTTRVQILCEKMVKDIMAENMKLYDALCAYFLGRSEAYKSMHEQFAAIGSANSVNCGSSSNAVQSELFFLRERVNELTEELQLLRESNATTDYQSELIAVREIFAEKKTASLSDESVPVNADVANDEMEVEKLEPAVVAEQPLLMAAQLSPCTIDKKPVSCDWIKSDTDVKPNVKEEIQTGDDAPGDDLCENDNVDVLNESKAGGTNVSTKRGYQCEYCHKNLQKKSQLDIHVRVHTGEKPFACKECDKRFSQNSHLRTHCRTHSGEKPFACKECDRRFTHSSTLLKHYLTHTGEKPLACQICNRRFARNENLVQHLRSHTGEKPFVCTICEKGFTRNEYLVRHCRVHTGEKPFACKNCKKRFHVKRDLLQHCRVHTDDRPYVCEHCEMAFRYKSGLRKHLLKKRCLPTLKKRKPAHVGSS